LKVNFKANIIRSQTRKVVANVYKYVKREAGARDNTNLKRTQKRVADTTEVSEKSLRRTVKEIKITESGDSTSSATLNKESLCHLLQQRSQL
jgi:transcription initiation factor TFIIIB Brf1 subunit/transcription initiation factor TFIIB